MKFAKIVIALAALVGFYFLTGWLDGLMEVSFQGVQPVWVYVHKFMYALVGALVTLGAGLSLK